MRAVVLEGPGPVETLEIRGLPWPCARDAWVRIHVVASGPNRSKLHTRLAEKGV